MIEQPRVLLNDFRAQWREIGGAALNAIDSVGHSGHLILGKQVTLFEESLSRIAGTTYVMGCANGLDAIEISLRAAGLKRGDRVITTPLSAFATSLAIIRAGGIPVFVDVDETGLLDLTAVETVLQRSGRFRFLLPVHLFGHAINLAQLSAVKSHFGLYVIEDCAQAICATSDGIGVGAIGDLSALSFYPTKNLGCMGDGGAILSNNQDFANVARALRDYGQTGKYVHTYIGLNSRLDELQAAILTHALLPRLALTTQRRRSIATIYRARISTPHLTIPPLPKGSESANHLFPILVDGDRTNFQKHLASCGIDSAIHYPVLIPDQPAMVNQTFEEITPLQRAHRFAECEVSLPIHPYLTDESVERVIDACNNWEAS